MKGTKIEEVQDIIDWLISNKQFGDNIICTFVIDKNENLLLADRYSEHVQCALGENILSTGEIGFEIVN